MRRNVVIILTLLFNTIIIVWLTLVYQMAEFFTFSFAFVIVHLGLYILFKSIFFLFAILLSTFNSDDEIFINPMYFFISFSAIIIISQLFTIWNLDLIRNFALDILSAFALYDEQFRLGNNFLNFCSAIARLNLLIFCGFFIYSIIRYHQSLDKQKSKIEKVVFNDFKNFWFEFQILSNLRKNHGRDSEDAVSLLINLDPQTVVEVPWYKESIELLKLYDH